VIEELHIRGLGVIEDTSLVLGPGLTVVTGETGAGKTMLVTALQLLLGARSSADLVRRGAEAAHIEALVRVRSSVPASGPPAQDDAEDGSVAELWGLAEDDVLIVSREIPADGRSRARVAGRLVPTATLHALLGPLVEIHGQHEHVRLEQPAVQRALLDGFGGPAHRSHVDAYRDAYRAWSESARRARLLQDDADARAIRLEALRAERDEIDVVAPDPDRDMDLDLDIERLANADALRAALDAAHAAAGTDGALEAIGAAVAALRRAPIEDPALLAFAERLRTASRDLSEVVADLAAAAADVEADDARLDALQDRKRALTPLLRRHGPEVADVLSHRAEVGERIIELEGLAEDAEGIDAAVEAARAALDVAADALRGSRRTVAAELTAAVGIHLAELGMPHAELSVALHPLDRPALDGSDRVELLLAANPGEPPVRLADAASGGERSRVALALEVVLTADRGSSVLVFDEVDAGIGGSTALAVGEKLARLAHRSADGDGDGDARQVLCVTHLAQVAAHADDHHVAEKQVIDGRTVTKVRRVEDAARVEELSRMLGGAATADAGLEHARGLLRAAQEQRATRVHV